MATIYHIDSELLDELHPGKYATRIKGARWEGGDIHIDLEVSETMNHENSLILIEKRETVL